MSYNNQF